MKSKSILILFITVLLFASVSCSKVSDEIIGTWYYQTFNDTPQGTITWRFTSSGELNIKSSLGGNFAEDTCNYFVSENIFKKRVLITNSRPMPGLSDFNGTYRVEEFKNNILVLVRIEDAAGKKGGAFLRCEMIRND